MEQKANEVRRVLCIKASAMPQELTEARMPMRTSIPDYFFKLPCYFIEKNRAEQDPDYVQLIPYIKVVHPKEGVLAYLRGRAGEENRLHDLWSNGIGGHVEPLDVDPMSIDTTNLPTLLNAARRELLEETGMHLTPTQFEGLGFNPMDMVGRVHLALFMTVTVDDDFVRKVSTHAEKGVIEEALFIQPDAMAQRLDQFEPWSRLAMF